MTINQKSDNQKALFINTFYNESFYETLFINLD